MRGLITQVFTAASIAGAANAAPWVRDDDGWYARALIAHDTLNGADGWRADLYGEYGLTDNWTLTAKTEAVAYPGASEFNREAYRLTLRRKLLVHDEWSVGVEAGPIYGGTTTGLNSCEGLGFETRGGLGYSGQLEGRAVYMFADAIYIQQEDGCARRRAEIGYGSDLTDHVFLTQQVWLESGDRSATSVKLENQIGLHLGAVDVSLGYREEIGGEFEETAILVALVARR
ncbi:MAG: hypothetical protein IPK75_10495 [Acidobacteria bacterium]|jgi:hypothetical protein|nr:hypothetical protein [Acidobacteriota bacterium]